MRSCCNNEQWLFCFHELFVPSLYLKDFSHGVFVTFSSRAGWIVGVRIRGTASPRVFVAARLANQANVSIRPFGIALLGNDEMARQFYSDQSILQYSSISPRDLPGTNTHQTLEASILLAQGLDEYLTSRQQEAFEDFNIATKLARRNGLAPYYAAKCLLELKRFQEAIPYFEQAAKYGRGRLAEEATRYRNRYR